jgi:hypothetical protein
MVVMALYDDKLNPIWLKYYQRVDTSFYHNAGMAQCFFSASTNYVLGVAYYFYSDSDMLNSIQIVNHTDGSLYKGFYLA